MTVVRGPVEFIMGSPPDEAGRTPDEARHRVRIPRSFAIATTEVTVAQFQQFLDANPEVKAQHTRPDVMRSAHRGGASRQTYFPSQRRDTVGFRVAKTIVDAHEAH